MATKRQRTDADGDTSTVSEPAVKRAKVDPTSPTVKVIVGQGVKSQEVYIHENILRKHSRFFDAALRGDWKEAHEGVVRLPQQKPELFSIFASFVYSRQIDFGPVEDTDSGEAGRRPKNFNVFLRSWRVGDILLSQTFQDAIVDALSAYMPLVDLVPTGMHRGLCRYTSLPNGLRRLLVDVAAFAWADSYFEQGCRDGCTSAFFAETTLRAREMTAEEIDGVDPWIDSGCRYHDHGEDKPCYKTMF